jgi:hypothetical protein
VIQYLTAEYLPEHFPERFPIQLPIPLVFIDIGESTCSEWATDYNDLCAALPRLPHEKIAKIFDALVGTEPELVVIDYDLHTEMSGADLSKAEVEHFSAAELAIRKSVQNMKSVPFLIAQPLFRKPKEDQKQTTDYVPVATILHNLDKPNIRFGQVEQDLSQESVLRRFPSFINILYADAALNPNSDDVGRIPHLAMRVCDVLEDTRFCKGTSQRAGVEVFEHAMSGTPDNCGNCIQFRYVLGRNIDRLAQYKVRVIEARALREDLNRSDFASAIKGALVFVGSRARGRGDFHFTPLDVFDGETPGLIVLANEVLAALQNDWLGPTSWVDTLIEKSILIFVSTIIVVLAFWYPRIRAKRAPRNSFLQKVVAWTILVLHFSSTIALVLVFNCILIWWIFIHYFTRGELADPITPMVAAVLDIFVDLSGTIGHRISSWTERLLTMMRESQR